MKKLTLIFLFFFSICNAQVDSLNVDSKYLEDQIYITALYQLLLDLPESVNETGFPYDVGLGFIKDIPFNAQRNVGIGVGIGYQFNVHYFNIQDPSIPEDDESELKSNKLALHMIDVPFELRFRTSTLSKYNFWRFYPGFKISYIFAKSNSLKQSEDFVVDKAIEINDFQYGLTLSAGYNKWNFHLYYGISELFNERKGQSFKIAPHELKLGLIFYLL